MDRIFNMDNKFFVFMGRVADLIILNIVFIICCIPIVTIGASITAMYYVTLKMVRNEESYIVKGFFKSFRENIKQATIIHLIMLFSGIILLMDVRIVNTSLTGTVASVFRVLFMALSLMYMMLLLYIYPVLAKFYNSIKNTFTNSFLMSIRHLPYTILMLVICAAPLAIFFIPSAQVQATGLLLLIMMGFSLVTFCNSFFMAKIFDNYIPKEEEATDELSELSALDSPEELPENQEAASDDHVEQ